MGLLSLSNLEICIKKSEFSDFKGLKVNLKIRQYPYWLQTCLIHTNLCNSIRYQTSSSHSPYFINALGHYYITIFFAIQVQDQRTLRRRQIFQVFGPLPPYRRQFFTIIRRQIWQIWQIFDPSPLRHADFLNGWSLMLY